MENQQNTPEAAKNRCHICNNWTREKGCDHYEADIHYRSFEAMCSRINNLEAGIQVHSEFELMQGAELNSLKAENEDLQNKLKFADRNCELLRAHRDKQAEQIRLLRQSLEAHMELAEGENNFYKDTYLYKQAKTALSHE